MYLGTATATFDSNGVAVSIVGPPRAREAWKVKQLVSRTDSTTPTKLDVFRYNTSGPRLDHTDRGNADVSPCDYDVPNGQKLAFQWTGGSAGASAYCDMDGERYGV